jgi:RNA polymerase sigma-70 factor, ECF subfamily
MGAGDITWAMAANPADAQTALFERVLSGHERPILRLCYRLLGNLADAQDAAQEVFLRVYRHRAQLSESRNPSAWLYQIAVNVCRDRRRKARLTGELDAQAVAGLDSPERDARHQQMQRHLFEALDALPEKERLALILRDLEERPAAEVAQILGSSEGTVRSQASTARAKLRKWFDERGLIL